MPVQQIRGPKANFTIRIDYFKPSGKWYTTATFNWHGATCGPPDNETCYMNDVVAHIRGLRDNGGQGAMPGLSAMSDGWDGYIVLTCDDGFPTLLLPDPLYSKG